MLSYENSTSQMIKDVKLDVTLIIAWHANNILYCKDNLWLQ